MNLIKRIKNLWGMSAFQVIPNSHGGTIVKDKEIQKFKPAQIIKKKVDILDEINENK